MLKFHVDLGMWDIIHLLYLFRSYFFICTLNPESLKFYLIISSFMQRYPVFSQVYAVLSKASRLSKDLKFYPRMEVSSKDMKIYLGILIFFTGIEFYPKIEASSKDINCYPRFELSSKDIRKVHYPVWHLKSSARSIPILRKWPPQEIHSPCDNCLCLKQAENENTTDCIFSPIQYKVLSRWRHWKCTRVMHHNPCNTAIPFDTPELQK